MSEWKVPRAHLIVLQNIQAGRGAWFGAERPKQRGFRGGLLTDLRCHALIDWTKDEATGLARYVVTPAGLSALTPSKDNTQ